MAITLYHVGRSPTFKMFDLDAFIERWITDSPADVACVDSSVPQKGDAHPDFAFMFVTIQSISETPANGAAISVTYTGCLKGTETPTLPETHHHFGTEVTSATTNTSSLIYPVCATEAWTLQYYSQTSTTISWGTDCSGGEEPDDPRDIGTQDILTFTGGCTVPAASSLSGILEWAITNAYVQGTIETVECDEIVYTQYFRITRKKSRVLLPYAPP